MIISVDCSGLSYLSHPVGKEKGDGEGRDVIHAGRLQQVTHPDNNGMPGTINKQKIVYRVTS